jgi:hypothetical protein
MFTLKNIFRTRKAPQRVYNINRLAGWFGHLQLSDITAEVCREYARDRKGPQRVAIWKHSELPSLLAPRVRTTGSYSAYRPSRQKPSRGTDG